jgi:Secretion system C-terminal sorting domain
MKKILSIAFCLVSVLTFSQGINLEIKNGTAPNTLEIWLKPLGTSMDWATSDAVTGLTFTVSWATTCNVSLGVLPGISNIGNPLKLVKDPTTPYSTGGTNNQIISGTIGTYLDNLTAEVATKVLTIPITGTGMCDFTIRADNFIIPGPPTYSGKYEVFKNYVEVLGNTLTNNANMVVLPIELQSFTADKKGDRSYLNWKVASEKNLNLYQLERSNDGVIFSNIYEIKAKANTINEKAVYEYMDEKPFSGVNYYRLKAVDKNGEFKYSKVASIDFGNTFKGKVYPNPFASDISVEMDINKNVGDVFVEVFDLVGKQIYYKKIAAETERMTIPVPTANLPDGTYLIRVKNGANIWQHKIVKN